MQPHIISLWLDIKRYNGYASQKANTVLSLLLSTVGTYKKSFYNTFFL